MNSFKLPALSAIILVICCVKLCESAGNYTIGFESFGSGKNSTHRPSPQRPHPTSPPRPNPTYRPSSHRPHPTSPPRPNPTYRPSSHRPQPTSPPRPNPTYHPKPNPTYWPPKTNPAPTKTTPRPARKTTPKPAPQQNPTPPPMWNIYSSNYPTNQAVPSTKVPTNTFKSDPTLLGLYTLMRSVVGVTLSQNGQSKPAKKVLRLAYPYYYDVYHYNQNRDKISNKIMVPYDAVGYCDAGTSDRTCVPGTYALCLLDWTIMCVTYSTATLPCYFNTSLQCATGKVPCNRLNPECSAMGNQIEVQTPCVANVTVTSPSAIVGSITQNSGPDPYASVVSAPIELCATTVLELKRLVSPVGAIVGLLTEFQNVIINLNVTQDTQIPTISPVAVQPFNQPVNAPPVTTKP